MSRYEYDVAGTPREAVIDGRRLAAHSPEDVVELFPRDPDLPRLGVVSYPGVPILDTNGELLGPRGLRLERGAPHLWDRQIRR